MARREGRNKGAGGNAGRGDNARERQNRRRTPRIRIGYTDLVKHVDGTFSLLLTAEVGGGDGSEQVQFFLDLDPKGNPVPMKTEISVDEYGHAQLRVSGITATNHIAKVVLVDSSGEPIGTPSRCTIDLAKSPRLPDKLHVRDAGRGRVFVPVSVSAQDGSPVKGALIDIYDVTNRFLTVTEARHTEPLFSLETNERGGVHPVPYVDVSPIEGKRQLLVHVAGTKLEAFVTCRAPSIRPPKAPANLSRVAATHKKQLFGTRTIRALLRGIRIGGEALRKQQKENLK